MFKRIINQPGFWRSVIALGVAFALLFVILKWLLDGFKFTFFTENDNLPLIALGLAAAGFFYGFFVTYGKFWKQLKEKDS
ncbi:MAG: hypothetical protein HKN48_13900 [Flavobacteriaceae bacterium]|nr:hypothetical protein [Flavobacteriaceae bacterium]